MILELTQSLRCACIYALTRTVSEQGRSPAELPCRLQRNEETRLGEQTARPGKRVPWLITCRGWLGWEAAGVSVVPGSSTLCTLWLCVQFNTGRSERTSPWPHNEIPAPQGREEAPVHTRVRTLLKRHTRKRSAEAAPGHTRAHTALQTTHM